MAKALASIMLGLLSVAQASAPLSKSEAAAAEQRLKKLMAFVDGQKSYFFPRYMQSCKNLSETFKTECTDKNVQDSTCNDAPDSLCCADGKVECDRCCDTCLSSSNPGYATSCVVQTLEGASVCGTPAGSDPDPIPAAPMVGDSCSTGPTHSEPSAILPDICLDPALFLQDAAAGKTAEAAFSANASYYEQYLSAFIFNPIVTNHANAVVRAEFTFTQKTCFLAVVGAQNKGKIIVDGTDKTYAIIHNPINYADADAISFNGGNAVILGGTNAGPINVNTEGKLEVYGVENSGPIDVKTSKDVIIADVANKASATIVVYNVSATLTNVVNQGYVTAKGGSYKAYGIVNIGAITIEAGDIELELLCPPSGSTAGTVTLKDGVTGKVTYAVGCKGTLDAPSTVTLVEASNGAGATNNSQGTANGTRSSTSLTMQSLLCLCAGILAMLV